MIGRKKVIDILQEEQSIALERLTLEYNEKSQSIDKYFENFKNGRTSIILSIDENTETSKYALNYN